LNSLSILGEPLPLGKKTIKNRIVMPAMGTGLASAQGEVTPALLKYYEERARGGAGAIVVEIACVDSPEGKASLTQLGIDRYELLAGLAELAETIQSYDCLAMVQLHHAGRQTAPAVTGLQPVAPSPKACRFMRAEPRQLSREEIASIRKRFIKAAVIAERAGFDGVELHAAHGYLLSQFLSPYTNLRDDEYGGSLENRFRLLKEIMEGVKNSAPGLILGVRFNLSDFVSGGIDLEEGLQIAQLIEQSGADVLNASCGIYESGQTSIETSSFPEGWRMDMIRRAKERASIPVVGGGVIRQPEMAARFISQGYMDLVWIGRGMLADPDWANKAVHGSPSKIRPCITCNTCFDTINKGRHIRCAVNPKTGREERMLRPLASMDNTVLVAKYQASNCQDKNILVTIDKAINSSLELRSKKELIERFIEQVNVSTKVDEDWRKFLHERKEADISAIIEEEKLKPEETRRFIDNAFRDGMLKTTGTAIDKIMPPVSRFGGGRAAKKQGIIEKLMIFFEKYLGLV
jgi:2,4-dienoyl-CoA reductase-like NADH-dependent reductase (Old Yellow Enzyme family)